MQLTVRISYIIIESTACPCGDAVDAYCGKNVGNITRYRCTAISFSQECTRHPLNRSMAPVTDGLSDATVAKESHVGLPSADPVASTELPNHKMLGYLVERRVSDGTMAWVSGATTRFRSRHP